MGVSVAFRDNTRVTETGHEEKEQARSSQYISYDPTENEGVLEVQAFVRCSKIGKKLFTQ